MINFTFNVCFELWENEFVGWHGNLERQKRKAAADIAPPIQQGMKP